MQAREIEVNFFYSPSCPHCAVVSDFLDTLEKEYPVSINKINVNEDPQQFLRIQQEYEVPSNKWSYVPKAFVADFYCIGETQCTDGLENKLKELTGSGPVQNQTNGGINHQINEINILQLTGLAAVDAVNPCALAVLIILLTAILTQFPKQRRKVLLAGLGFTGSILLCYFGMGLLIILGFKTVTAVTQLSSLWFYRILGGIAILLGLFNLKDAIKFGAGGFVMEVPMSWRPRMKKLLSSTTSPLGALLIGFVVSLFLLPCTSGPYFVAGGILAGFNWFQAFVPLLLYNIIFVLPMIGITLFVYLGFAKIEDLGGWREKNINKLHLVAGLILIGLGIAMVLGLV